MVPRGPTVSNAGIISGLKKLLNFARRAGLTVPKLEAIPFQISRKHTYIPAHLLLNCPSVFTTAPKILARDDWTAVIATVKDTATSPKAFNVVFQPIMYGYLDLEEILNKQKNIRQGILPLLVDSIKLADAIEAQCVVDMLLEELSTRKCQDEHAVKALARLTEARPATDPFLVRHIFGFEDREDRSNDEIKQHVQIISTAMQDVDGFTDLVRDHWQAYSATRVAPLLLSTLVIIDAKNQDIEQQALTTASDGSVEMITQSGLVASDGEGPTGFTANPAIPNGRMDQAQDIDAPPPSNDLVSMAEQAIQLNESSEAAGSEAKPPPPPPRHPMIQRASVERRHHPSKAVTLAQKHAKSASHILRQSTTPLPL